MGMGKFKFKRGFKSESEKKALFYRKKLDLKKYDPLPSDRLAHHLRVKIIFPSNIPGMNAKLLSRVQSKNEWSAVTIQTETGNVIIHNDKHSLARQESDIMHELAHLICKHPFDALKIDQAGNICLRSYIEEYEKEAEWLGGCLQLNRESLLWSLSKRMDVNSISRHFCASKVMVTFRLNMTVVLRQYPYFDPFS